MKPYRIVGSMFVVLTLLAGGCSDQTDPSQSADASADATGESGTAASAPEPASPRRVLVFSKTAGFRHSSIPAGIACVERLMAEREFDVEATEESSIFNDEDLSRFGVIVFLNTTGDVLDESQQEALQRFVRSGRGWVGVHSASDTEYDWPWYGRLVGAYFQSHPKIQEARIEVTDDAHPATSHLPAEWIRRDEWYDFKEPPVNVRVLLSLDERSYEGGRLGIVRPMSWCHEYDGGRAFYTAPGHTDESYEEPAFERHLLGGILWAAGIESVD